MANSFSIDRPVPIEEASPLEQAMFGSTISGGAPALELPAYLELVRHLPAPTEGQIQAFAEYVCGAKSWYKHLSPVPPGQRFCFFLHPQAGRARLLLANGQARMIERTNGTPSCHYSVMTTEAYRNRFGFLAFSGPTSTGLFVPVEVGKHEAALYCNPSVSLIQVSPGAALRPPHEVLDAGTCHVTGLVDPRMLATAAATRRLVRNLGTTELPDDDHTWAALIERCRSLIAIENEPGTSESESLDHRLWELVARKRAEHVAEMIAALHRACELIYGT